MTTIRSEGKTEVESIETFFTWIIPNISSRETVLCTEENIVSHSHGNIKYSLKLYPYAGKKTHMSLYLYVISSDKIDISTRCHIQEMNGLGHFSYNKVKENKTLSWGWSQFFDRKKICSLQDDTITIKCHLNLKPYSTNSCIEYNSWKNNKEMLTNLNNLLSSGKFSDAVLKTSDGTEFPVHKCILSMQSSVFLAMFQDNMLENLNNTVKIDDVDSNVLKAMLEFIYSNKFDKKNLIFDKLLIASDQYDIKNLKSICEVELSNRLTVDNAIDYLRLSDMHESKLLKKHALNFIAENLNEMLQKNSFQTLEIERPRLFTDILQSINNKKST